MDAQLTSTITVECVMVVTVEFIKIAIAEPRVFLFWVGIAGLSVLQAYSGRQHS
jgi:hypothetical protein